MREKAEAAAERESDKEANEEERDTLTVSWCHLAQYLSSKDWARRRLKASCISLFSLSNNQITKSTAHVRTRAVARTCARAI